MLSWNHPTTGGQLLHLVTLCQPLPFSWIIIYVFIDLPIKEIKDSLSAWKPRLGHAEQNIRIHGDETENIRSFTEIVGRRWRLISPYLSIIRLSIKVANWWWTFIFTGLRADMRISNEKESSLRGKIQTSGKANHIINQNWVKRCRGQDQKFLVQTLASLLVSC